MSIIKSQAQQRMSVEFHIQLYITPLMKISFYNIYTRKADQSTWNSPKYVNSYSDIVAPII